VEYGKEWKCTDKKKKEKRLQESENLTILTISFQGRVFVNLLSNSAIDLCNARACGTEVQGDQISNYRSLI